MEDTIASVHTLRIKIDACIKETERLGKVEGARAGRELALVKTKLEEGKMWSGKALGQLGSELPEQYRDEAK